jgi:hypothetical protein
MVTQESQLTASRNAQSIDIPIYIYINGVLHHLYDPLRSDKNNVLGFRLAPSLGSIIVTTTFISKYRQKLAFG